MARRCGPRLKPGCLSKSGTGSITSRPYRSLGYYISPVQFAEQQRGLIEHTTENSSLP